MELPHANAGTDVRVRYARTLSGRLVHARYDGLVARVDATTDALLAARRALYDLEGDAQRAVALRNAVDDEIDRLCREVRVALSGRGVDAVRSVPYTNLFPKGVAYYTKAPLDKQTERYSELIGRMKRHLDPDDPVRTRFLAPLQRALAAWKDAAAAVEVARNEAGYAKTARGAARAAWIAEIESVYGALVARLGRQAAERFFPRGRRGPGDVAGGGGDPGAGSAGRFRSDGPDRAGGVRARIGSPERKEGEGGSRPAWIDLARADRPKAAGPLIAGTSRRTPGRWGDWGTSRTRGRRTPRRWGAGSSICGSRRARRP